MGSCRPSYIVGVAVFVDADVVLSHVFYNLISYCAIAGYLLLGWRMTSTRLPRTVMVSFLQSLCHEVVHLQMFLFLPVMQNQFEHAGHGRAMSYRAADAADLPNL